MIGRTNSGSGKGGISPNNALLKIYTPLGSSVTATNGSVTKTSRRGIVLSDDPTIEIHLFSIGISQFGTWTVTASLSSYYDVSDTVTINSPGEYEITLQYKLFLYDLGDENISITGGLNAYPYGISGAGSTRITPTVTRNQDSIKISTGSTPTYQTFMFASSNPINITSYSVAKIVVTAYSDASTSTDQAWITFIDELKDNYPLSTYAYINSATEISLDVSNITGLMYPVIGLGGTHSFNLTFSRWWLE